MRHSGVQLGCATNGPRRAVAILMWQVLPNVLCMPGRGPRRTSGPVRPPPSNSVKFRATAGPPSVKFRQVPSNFERPPGPSPSNSVKFRQISSNCRAPCQLPSNSVKFRQIPDLRQIPSKIPDDPRAPTPTLWPKLTKRRFFERRSRRLTCRGSAPGVRKPVPVPAPVPAPVPVPGPVPVPVEGEGPGGRMVEV